MGRLGQILIPVLFVLTSCDDGYIERKPVDTGNDTSSTGNLGDPQRGEGLFNRYCAHCHGIDAKGSVSVGAPDVRGKSAEDIESAIDRVSFMSGLSGTLDTNQLQDISAYLSELSQTDSANTTSRSNRTRQATSHSLCELTWAANEGVTETKLYTCNEAGLFPSPSSSYPLTLTLDHPDYPEKLKGWADTNQPIVYVNELSDTLVEAITQSQKEPGDLQSLSKHIPLPFSASMITALFALETASAETHQSLANRMGELLKTERIPNCQTPINPHGWVFNNDTNYDCFPD